MSWVLLSKMWLAAMAGYLACGALFGAAFVVWGAVKIDVHARQAGWGFRLLLLPGSIFLWPLLATKWGAARRGAKHD